MKRKGDLATTRQLKLVSDRLRKQEDKADRLTTVCVNQQRSLCDLEARLDSAIKTAETVDKGLEGQIDEFSDYATQDIADLFQRVQLLAADLDARGQRFSDAYNGLSAQITKYANEKMADARLIDALEKYTEHDEDAVPLKLALGEIYRRLNALEFPAPITYRPNTMSWSGCTAFVSPDKGKTWSELGKVTEITFGKPQPTYYVRHPDETYTVADPQPKG